RRRHPELLVDAKTGDACELDEVSLIAGLGELRDAADAADLVEIGSVLGSGMCGVGLYHADQAVTGTQRVIEQCDGAGFEDIERHLSARQYQRPRQRKDRDHIGEIVRPLIDRIHRHGRFLSAAMRPKLFALTLLGARPGRCSRLTKTKSTTAAYGH